MKSNRANIIKDSHIRKAINYHVRKNTKEHTILANHLKNNNFYNYCVETIKFKVRPYDSFRNILDPVVQSLYMDRPTIIISHVDPITNYTTYKEVHEL